MPLNVVFLNWYFKAFHAELSVDNWTSFYPFYTPPLRRIWEPENTISQHSLLAAFPARIHQRKVFAWIWNEKGRQSVFVAFLAVEAHVWLGRPLRISYLEAGGIINSGLWQPWKLQIFYKVEATPRASLCSSVLACHLLCQFCFADQSLAELPHGQGWWPVALCTFWPAQYLAWLTSLIHVCCCREQQ